LAITVPIKQKNYLKLPAAEGICWNTENYGLVHLNPIEQFWGELENKLDRSIVLWLELQKLWENISVEVLRKYSDTTPERCAAVIAVKGGHTKS